MKKLILIIIGLALVVVTVFIVWQMLYLKQKKIKEVYLLPKDFKGLVLIAYNQENGLEDTVKDDTLIYRIPLSGILKLKQKLPSTVSQSWYYSEDEHGNRTSLPHCFAPCIEMQKNPSTSFVYGKSNGVSLGEGQELKWTVFLVGSKQDTDSLSRYKERLNPLELLGNSKY